MKTNTCFFTGKEVPAPNSLEAIVRRIEAESENLMEIQAIYDKAQALKDEHQLHGADACAVAEIYVAHDEGDFEQDTHPDNRTLFELLSKGGV